MTARRTLIGIAGAIAAVWLALAGSATEPAPVDADGTLTVVDTSRNAYSLPAPGLPEARRAAFFRGRNLFRQVWIAAPSTDEAVDGLGPGSTGNLASPATRATDAASRRTGRRRSCARCWYG